MKKLLIVVDFQNDFVSGALGFPKATTLEKGICAKIEAYLQNEDDVIFTLDTHTEDYLETLEGKNLPIVHCLQHSEGWQLYGKTRQYQERAAAVIEKPGFGSLELMEYLRTHGYASIELAGLVTNICILANAVGAKTACPETPVLVDASLCASFDEVLHEKTLDVLEGIQVQVINREKA